MPEPRTAPERGARDGQRGVQYPVAAQGVAADQPARHDRDVQDGDPGESEQPRGD